MPLLGIIGFPLGHSFSPAYFNEKFRTLGMHDWHYSAFPLEHIDSLPDLIRQNKDLIAFNVTIPHKKDILHYCHEMDEAVTEIGAANLILVKREGEKFRLKAYNTDYQGFLQTLHLPLNTASMKALILGTGGSSLAIEYALKKQQIIYDSVGRNTQPSYSEINLSEYDLIINCTPVGMAPIKFHSVAILPLDYSSVKKGALFYDLIYNPSETQMMKLFAENGAQVKNGLEMLHAQAEAGWTIVSSHA